MHKISQAQAQILYAVAKDLEEVLQQDDNYFNTQEHRDLIAAVECIKYDYSQDEIDQYFPGFLKNV